MKIIILGSRGNLGSQLMGVFADDEESSYSVIGWDKDDVDITDKDLILKKINDVNPDIVINATAYNAVDRCEDDEEEFFKAKRLNGEAVGYLAEAAIENNAVLVHFVSDYVFSGENKDGYKESDETNPVSKYGQTKVMGEKEMISRSGEGLRYYLIRVSKLFGPKGNSDFSKESFFDLILRLSSEQKEFKMVDGEEISCFTYTPDLAKEVKGLLEAKAPYGIYHLANSEAVSWYQAAKYLFELKGISDVKLVPVKSSDYPRPAKRPKYSILLNTKTEPLRSWKEALREYLNYNN